MDETCPFCGHAAKFETKDAPAWFLRKGIAPQVVHVSEHEPCRDYWFAAADGAAHTEAGHLPFMRALGAEEKQFYAETVRRLRDGGAWLILYLEWSLNLLACFRVAQAASAAYGLRDAKVLHSGTGFDGQNLMLMLEDGAGLHPIRVHAADADLDTMRSKVFWLQALDRAGVRVPRPQRAESGEELLWVEAGQAGRWCVLYDWIPGEMIGYLDPEKRPQAAIENIGVSLAKMHRLSATMTLPDWFKRPAYGPEAVTLFVRNRSYPNDQGEVERALDGLLDAMRALDAVPPAYGLIHGETGTGNILLEGDAVALIDFQRFGWGYYLTDIQKLSAILSAQEQAWFLAAYGDVFALPDRFDAHYAAFDEARTVLGHWT